MKLAKNRESGQALIMALILLGLGSLLIVPSLNLAGASLKYHQLIERETLESYSADSGLQYALCKLHNNPGGYTEVHLEESFTINDRTVNVTAEYMGSAVYKITSTATSSSGRSTTIESYITLSVGIFAFAIATKDDMAIKDTTVDSSPDAGEGNIHSNANISLGAGCIINGDATAVGIISGQESVTGIVTEGSLPVAFPGDYSQLYESMAKEGGIHTGDLKLTGDTEYLGPLYISGSLTIGSGTTVILEGTVYVTGMIRVGGGRLVGEENVVAEGDIHIEGGGFGSAENIPVITSTNGDIRLDGPIVDAVVYAPNGIVYLKAVHIYGAVGGKTVRVKEWSTITYAKQLQGREDIPGGELHTITYSFN